MENSITQSANSIVSFQNVSKRYQLQEAVHNLTFELSAGKVIGMIGPNGSGKTTTLKLMSGLLQPTRGTVLFDGEPVRRRTAAGKMSYLSDAAAVYSFYTVGQMVDYYHGIFSDFDKQKAREMLSFMNLDENQNVRTLSKGNLGRLKIVLTVSRNASLIVMDEPLSGLDPLVRQSIMKGLISFVDLAIQTVVLSTHEVEEVEPLLDVVMLLQHGEMKAMAYTDDIRTEYGKNMVEWMKTVLERSAVPR